MKRHAGNSIVLGLVSALTLTGCFGVGLAGYVHGQPAMGKWEFGPVMMSGVELPAPAGTRVFEVPGGNCELQGGQKGLVPAGWHSPAGTLGIACVTSNDGPQGAYMRVPALVTTGIWRNVRSPNISVPGNQPFVLSFWWRSQRVAWISFSGDAGLNDTDLNEMQQSGWTLPSTDGKWQRANVYVRTPWRATLLNFTLQCDKIPGVAYDLDDMRLRSATEDEFSTAWQAMTHSMVKYDITPREDDGRNLALAIRKLQGGGIPGRPFVVWVPGCSWGNYLGDGENLRQVIRQRFPDAPEVAYKKHMGSGTTFKFMGGWISQFVASDYPDLVLIYTYGTPSDLDEALRAIRSRCTADIIVASGHFYAKEEETWRQTIDTPRWVEVRDVSHAQWPQIREVCQAHGVEYVENRRELARYLEATGGTPKTLLLDPYHQNLLGSLLINLNIARHLAIPKSFAYDPDSRERRIRAELALQKAPGDVVAQGQWQRREDGSIATAQAGAKLTCAFKGNRVDLIGRALTNGGTVRVKIDGVPADELKAYAMTFIRPDRGIAGEVAPHAVSLGANVAPQEWSITMLDTNGNYELTGSVTGPDGRGNNRAKNAFVSQSGQIVIDHALWRAPKECFKGVWRWKVNRCTTGKVSFVDGTDKFMHERLAQNMAPGTHTAELDVVGDGPVAIDSFYVFNPPE